MSSTIIGGLNSSNNEQFHEAVEATLSLSATKATAQTASPHISLSAGRPSGREHPTPTGKTPVMSSRLLEIPAEMRNQLYRNLLVDHKPHEGCHPQILVTCKHIRDEASALLTTDNEVHITISEVVEDRMEETQYPGVQNIRPPSYAHPYLGGEIMETVSETGLQCHTQQWTTGSRHPSSIPMLALPGGKDAWPAYLRQVQRLRLQINLKGFHQKFEDLATNPFGDVATLLFTLKTFLEAGHQLRFLGISIDLGDSGMESADPIDDGNTDLTAIQSLFYPLRRFGYIVETTLHGLPSVDRERLLKWTRQGPSYCTNSPKADAHNNSVAAHPDLDDETVRRGLQRECVLRPNLLLRYACIEQEYRAFIALCTFLGLPVRDTRDPETIENSYDMAVRWISFGILDEWHEQCVTLWLEILREGLDNFFGDLSKVMSDSSREEYKQLAVARGARLGVWALDDYEKLELDRVRS